MLFRSEEVFRNHVIHLFAVHNDVMAILRKLAKSAFKRSPPALPSESPADFELTAQSSALQQDEPIEIWDWERLVSSGPIR